MQIGVMITGRPETDFVAEFNKVKDMGLSSCQISIWDMDMYTDETAAKINEAVEKTGIPCQLCGQATAVRASGTLPTARRCSVLYLLHTAVYVKRIF